MFILIINIFLIVLYTTYIPSNYDNPILYGVLIVAILNSIYIYIIIEKNKSLKVKIDEYFIKASKAGNISITDPLTGAYNRRHFDIVFDRMYEESKNRDINFSLILIDIDHFKRFNDTYGHNVGDEVLKTVVNTIRRNIRKNFDMFFRYGGEEFIIINSDNKEGSINLAKKINKLEFNNVEKITISIGVSFFRKGVSKNDMIKIADDNLYKAKEQGRNRVIYEDN